MKKEWVYNPKTGSFEKELPETRESKKTNLRKNYNPESGSFEIEPVVTDEKKSIELFGVKYGHAAYVNDFLPLVYENLERATKNTDMEDVKLKLHTSSADDKKWNCKSVYPMSKNAFINKYFADNDPKGLEGIWHQENWGLVGLLRSKNKNYSKINIKIDGFDSKHPHPMFHEETGKGSWSIVHTDDVEKNFNISGQFVQNSKIDGTLDGEIISTSDKNKFKYVGRKTYLAKINSLSAPVNVKLTMQMSIINDNLFEMIPPYGDNSIVCKRVWPHGAVSENRGFKPLAGSGSAFFVDNKGHLVTNYHVVEHSDDECKIVFYNKEVKAKIIAKDKKLDLALLKTSVKNKHFITISNKPPEKLQRIIAAGYPLGKKLSDDLKFTSGIISSLKGYDDNTAEIQIDAALNPGNSGGPIVDEKTGKLVAVAVAGMQKDMSEGINFGIKASQLRDFLDANKINNRRVSLKDSAISTILEHSTVYIFFE